MMRRTHLHQMFQYIEEVCLGVAELLDIALDMDEVWYAPEDYDVRCGADPQVHATFSLPDDREFVVMFIAHENGCGMHAVPDGDMSLPDEEGFAQHPWRAAVMEELAVKLQERLPKAAQHLREQAAVVHDPPPEALTYDAGYWVRATAAFHAWEKGLVSNDGSREEVRTDDES